MAIWQARILGGTDSGSTDDATVKIVAQHTGQTQGCSGVLIAPNLVLTARHCVADFVNGTFTCDANGDTINGPAGDTGTTIAPEKVTIQVGSAPDSKAKDAIGLQIFALQTTTICRNDIALVLLDRALNGLPTVPIRLDRGTERGEIVSALGYGTFETDKTDAGFASGVRHVKSELKVTKVGKSQFLPNGDDVPPRTFQLEGGGFCIGDSGGPALSERGAAMGVFSKATADCQSSDTASHFAETGPYSDELIRPAFLAAGYEPIAEIGLGAAGAAGSPVETGAAGFDSSSLGTAGTSNETSDAGGSAGSSAAPEMSGGRPATSESAQGGDGGEDDELVYEGAPPKGGACVCGIPAARGRGFPSLLIAATACLAYGRRLRSQLGSHSRRVSDRGRKGIS